MKIVITVPGHLGAHPGVSAALDTLLALAGGCTVCPAQGQWLDPHGALVLEPVEQYHFCFVGGEAHMDNQSIGIAKNAVILAILQAGEKAVLVEYHRARGYNCVIYTAKDVT